MAGMLRLYRWNPKTKAFYQADWGVPSKADMYVRQGFIVLYPDGSVRDGRKYDS